MNKRKLRRVAIVALVLVLLCNTLGVQASTKKDDPTVIVKDYGSLYTAIAEAKDNDVIGIQGTITIPAIVDLNMSENKAVILRRMKAGTKLVVSGDYGADNKASFRMISFDGNSTEVSGTEPFVEINGNAYFSMCDFTECFNQSDNGGAINISSGEVELSGCSFDENSASYGSHIFNAGTLLVNSCTLKGGWADELGGAIYNRGTLTVNGTEIKENNARIGGGIYNNSSLEVDNSLIWSNTATVQGTDIANEGTYTNSTTEEQFDSWLNYYKLYYAGWEDDTNTSVGGSGDYLKFLTATEKPTKPDPTEPVDPEPTEPPTPDPVTPPSGGDEGKTDPEPTDSTPTEPTDPAPTDPEPTDPNPTEPDKPDATEPPTEDPKPSTPSNADQTGGGDTTTDNSDHSNTDNSQHNSTTNNSSSVGGNTTNSSTVSNTDNSRSESSRTENSNNSSTVNNYYQQDKQEPATASTNASQPVNVTVPVTVSTPEGQESQIQPVNEVSTVNAPESTTEPHRSPNWVEYITMLLLAVLVGLEIKDKLHKGK
ncbi:MAG: hypothetical protein KHY46_12445 [Clostridiales bacterium]|nr:hypothetical protein [Clostridiales bacterium]